MAGIKENRWDICFQKQQDDKPKPDHINDHINLNEIKISIKSQILSVWIRKQDLIIRFS